MSKLDNYIRETPDALLRLIEAPPDIEALRAAWRSRSIAKAYIAGSGTSYYAAKIAARIWQEALPIEVRAIGALEFVERQDEFRIGRDTMAIGISQTGATNVLVEGMTRAARKGALTLGCTAFADSPLAETVEFVLDSRTGREDTPGKTKGFITTTAAVGMVALATATHDETWRTTAAALERRVRHAVAASAARATDWAKALSGITALWVVGSGRMTPAAMEGGLKILEVAKLPVIGKELEEMMHGQFHAIGEGAAIVLLAGRIEHTARIDDLRRVVHEVGVPLIAIADADTATAHANLPWDLVLDLEGVGPFEALVGAVPLQILAERLARARGLDPDRPRYPALYKISGSKSIYAGATRA